MKRRKLAGFCSLVDPSERSSGSVYDAFGYDPTIPPPDAEGGFFVDLLHYAKIFQICLSAYLYDANRATFHQYLFYGSSPVGGAAALLRGCDPRVNSKASDPISVSQDPFAGGYLTPEVADQSFSIPTGNGCKVTRKIRKVNRSGITYATGPVRKQRNLIAANTREHPPHENEHSEDLSSIPSFEALQTSDFSLLI
jgi:hypothetical protein